MEGLEVEEIHFSETLENKDFRVDSDFWTKEPFRSQKLKYEPIGKHLEKSQYGISISMNEDATGYPIFRMNEIHNMLCDLEVSKCADISADEAKKFILKDGDVLFNRTNSFEWVGRTGIYYETDKVDRVFASYLVRFIPNKKIIPEYLATFLTTQYGVMDVKRRSRHSINQTNVNPEEVKEILIPLLDMRLQEKIRSCFKGANKNRVSASLIYKNAESLLLSEIGFDGFVPSAEKVNIKPFSQSFLMSDRLDAEYYQPKYENYAKLIKKYKYGFEQLQTACNLKDNNFNPDEKSEYRYIELSNIGKTGDVTGCTVAQGSELPSRARRKTQINDVVISSIEGSLESCALIPKAYDEALCSTGFYVINSDKINSETLLVLFKSEPMQAILKQSCSGTILTAINKNEFTSIPVPLIDKEIQRQIKEKLNDSFSLREKSSSLLAIAKRAVEIAIENDEAAAECYIQTECAALDASLEKVA